MDCAQKRGPDVIVDSEKSSKQGKYKVSIAATVLFGHSAIVGGYHTSILIDDEEYFFTDSGIWYDNQLLSHQGTPTETVEVGRTDYSGTELWWALSPHFRAGSYDFLKKNCNAFSDCALFFLTRGRLPSKYRTLDKIGDGMPETFQRVTAGWYKPNPDSQNWSLEETIEEVQKIGIGKRVTGPPRPRQVTLNIGAQVTLVGLKNAAQLNGQAATIERLNIMTGRWEAKLESGDIKAFRAENLRPIGEVFYEAGDLVRIDGLKSDAGQALNGKEGCIVGYLHDGARYEVSVNGDTKAMKSDNLTLIDKRKTGRVDSV